MICGASKTLTYLLTYLLQIQHGFSIKMIIHLADEVLSGKG